MKLIKKISKIYVCYITTESKLYIKWVKIRIVVIVVWSKFENFVAMRHVYFRRAAEIV